ncbi:hemin receptor [Acinetobacter baumannii]|uniref:hemin receptor n=1 Tax=Acinetobacter baumannii TaxID=470 RepID=UPI000D35EFD2|nr:hemin receptor [Acinetobacter baumannii]ELA7823169.1 hemin receptor [Acinetobacter baumannii]MDC4296763.1 hemin receptor [Acinetobacter baumannii]MDC5045096.1 hemin receptor [Acinetobacter baumannii]MDC5269364.1 hemin receptor [Acinetobacter baumannii]MDC5371904.1 hemin receptor [Acinetobacter baumannii]
MTESLGKLGPHEGQELELLLSGHKSIALFYELLPIEFIKHLEQGSLSMLSKDIETSLSLPFSIMLIYKDASLADLNELMLCIEKSLKETQLEDRLELDRRIGQLLGYSVQDIEFYIQHISNRHLKTKI